jgi:hypothetical protein
MELFGPNAWLNGFYLAALKAGAEMAEFLGEPAKAREYQVLFEQGKAWTDEHLFNGEYYMQKIALADCSILDSFAAHGGGWNKQADIYSVYWNAEAGEIKYQIGEGCGIDQVVAQWHANLCGLGEIFAESQVQKALEAIYTYNFKPSFRNYFNPCRVFSLNDEAGVVICDWPSGKYKPVVPVTYAEETMNGFEYQVAIHMIQEGMIAEGLEIVRAIRERYDGEKRNPWNEFECGSNYARSMASYALLLAFSGFEFNMVEGMLGFNPIKIPDGYFKCFWSLDSGWGTFEMQPERVELRVLYGKLTCQRLRLRFAANMVLKSAFVNDEACSAEKHETDIIFTPSIPLDAGDILTLSLEK